MAPEKKIAPAWRELECRLETAHAALSRAWEPDAEETRRTLRARAAALAKEAPAAPLADAHLEVVQFLLAEETYAVEARYVREVCLLEDLAPLPCTPAFVLGIANVRGEILSVIDIKRFFELPEKGLTDLNKILILESDAMRIGVLADAVVGVRRIPLAAIRPSLPTLTGIREEFLRGVTPERTVVLDAGRLLAAKSIVVREQVAG